jgi:hypothetical protein
MAITIGTTGDEPPPLSDAGVDVAGGRVVCCTAPFGVPAEPLSGLRCPVPPLLPVVGVPPVVAEDVLPFEDPAPECPVVVVSVWFCVEVSPPPGVDA